MGIRGLIDLMNAEQVYLVRKTFSELARHDHVAALVFYRRLFELDPSLRQLFKSDIEQQAHRLLDMLGVLIAQLERPSGLDMELRGLGARHVDYGVQDEHYATVGQALLGMIGEVLGDQFTPPVRAAWTALFETVQSAMLIGAAQARAARPHI